MVPAAEVEDEELPAESPQFFTSLSEVVPPSVVDEEREEEEEEPAPKISSLNSLGQAASMEDEEEEEEDEKEEDYDTKEKIKKIRAELYRGVRLPMEDVEEGIMYVYGDPDGTLRSVIEGDSEEFIDGRRFIETDVLILNGTPFSLYNGRVFSFSQDTNEWMMDIDRMVDEEDEEYPADSFRVSEVRPESIDEVVSKIKETQQYVLRNATREMLPELVRRTNFFDEFIDRDEVRDAISQRTGRGKMKGGKFFLSDLWDMIMGKRHLEY